MVKTSLPSLRDFALMLETASNDPALLEIRRLLGSANLFRILGTESRERWHSAFLAWALDPNGSHGLGDFPLRRFLTLLTKEQAGTIQVPGALMEFTAANVTINSQWGNHDDVPLVADAVPLADLLNGSFALSVAAPGPETDYCEVTARTAVVDGRNGESGAERSRFDVLIVAHRTPPADSRTAQRQSSPDSIAPDVVVLAVELKVDARFDREQLVRYSTWVHAAPVPAGLAATSTATAAFAASYANLLETAMVRRGQTDRPLRVFGVGAFVGKARVVSTARQTAAENDRWSYVDFDVLARHVLEPMLQHPRLGASARNLLDEYLLLIGAQNEGSLMQNVSSHYRELAQQFVARNAEMLRVLVKVLDEPESIAFDLPATTPLADQLEQVAEQTATSRREILSPEHLLAAKYIELGDRFVHTPVKAGGSKPFEESLVAIVDGGAKRGFQLVEGPEATDHIVAAYRHHSATGLLKEVYAHFDRRYAGSGNEGWVHEKTSKTLAQLYNDFVAERG